MRMESLIRPNVPIQSHTKPAAVKDVTVLPDVGKRWGKPSQFQFHHDNPNAGSGRGGFEVEPREKRQRQETIELSGSSREFVVRKEDGPGIGTFVRRTNVIWWTGSRPHYVARDMGDGVTVYVQGKVNISLTFNLVLHEDEDG